MFPVLLWYSLVLSASCSVLLPLVSLSAFSSAVSPQISPLCPVPSYAFKPFDCVHVTLALCFLVPNCNKVLSCYVSCILHFGSKPCLQHWGTWDVGVIQLWKAYRTVTNIHEVTDTCSCICTQLQCMLQPSIKYLLPMKLFSTCKESYNVKDVN